MAFLGYSDDFDLDDDGILRDSGSTGGILIDDDGIVRDDFDNQSKYTSSTTHWTDSGLGGQQSAAGSTSTLRQFDLQSYPSIEDFSHPLNDSHANISDLEASKDDLTFEEDFRDSFDRDIGYDDRGQSPAIGQSRYGQDSLNFDDTEENLLKSTTDSNQKELFDTDYYKQLQELGVLVDGVELPDPDLPNPQASLNEFEQLEAHLSREHIEYEPEEPEDKTADPIQDFLRRTPTRNLESPAFDRGRSPAFGRNLQSPAFGNLRGTTTSPGVERGGWSKSRNQQSPATERDFDISLSEEQPIRPFSAGSARTISSRSFPEISPEEALQYYRDSVTGDELDVVDHDAASLDFEGSQRTCDDDEIFIITSRISDAPKPAKLRAYEVGGDHDTQMTYSSNYSSRSASRTSQASNQGNERRGNNYKGGYSAHDRSFASSQGDRSFDVSLTDTRGFTSRDGSITPTSVFSDTQPTKRSDSATPTNLRASPRPDSVTSQRSDRNSSRSNFKSDQLKAQNQSLSKAHSQESFLDHSTGAKDKMPKRLLPKPTAGEVNQSYRVKSKSTTNISSKPGPVKPKHNSLSDLSHQKIYETDQDTYDPHSEGLSATSDKSRNELSSKLNQEFHKRKQATELVQQLQKDYDKLLSKYATAELTIDQLRLGARVNLHVASPTPSQGTTGSVPNLQQPLHVVSLQRAGIKSPSPSQGSIGYASPLPNDSTQADTFNGARNKLRRQSEPAVHAQSPREAGEMALSMENGAESVKIGLMFQAHSLDERMESFRTLLNEDQLTHQEQEKVFDKIRTDHEKLRREYLQSKEDYNVLKRSNTSVGADVNFDEEKELEGELFKVGMKFDEIHAKVDEEMQKKSSQRQPFQNSGRMVSDTDGSVTGSDLEGRSVDQLKQKMKSVKAGDDLVHPKTDSEFGKKLNKLHEDYNNLMDRYRRLKQMAQTPERDKEIDNLVRKLHHICNQEPEVFRMPGELQERFEQIQEQDVAMQRRRSSTSSQKPMASVQNQSFTRLPGRETPTGLNSSQRSHLQQNGVASPRGHYRESPRDSRDSNLNDDSFRSSYSSRGNTPRDFDGSFDRNSPNPRLPRPRRHEHPDRKPGMKKRPESGSWSSLQDSGISEHDEPNGAVGGNLSNIPGPGKFKQMTKQRNAHDADSGFIGSMVGSEVSQMSSRQQQQNQQPTLRLRQPSDQDDRLRSRLRDADTSSITSSRSGRLRQGERPSSRGSLRSDSHRGSRDSANMTRDFTDDSYTLTESEMSFDSQQSRNRRDQTRQRGKDMVSKAIQEEEEGEGTLEYQERTVDLGWLANSRGRAQPVRPKQRISQESPRPSSRQHQESLRTPAKSKRGNVSFSEEDVTPQRTPSMSFNSTREMLSSEEEETPRQVINQPYQKLEVQKTPTVTRQQERLRPPTPGAVVELPRPSTPGVREQTRSKRRGSLRSQESERSRLQEEVRPKMVDRSIGSDSDDGSDAPTVATRGSQGSEKFSILKDEIGKLREEFQKANEQQKQQLLEQQRQQQLQQQQMAQPVLPQPTNQKEDDYYFDPTEDPYAFMRGPRRRANSFSGAPTRDWDEWWRMPLNPPQTGDEIPLGYAAADSYATPRRRNQEETTPDSRVRNRQRLRRRYRRGVDTEVQTPRSYESDQAPTQATASTTDEQLYNYYVPQYVRPQIAVQQQTVPPATGVTPQTYISPPVSGRRPAHYASQPNLVYSAYPQEAAAVPPQPHLQPQQHLPTPTYSTPISAGYRQRRQMNRPRSQYTIPSPAPQPVYSYDDIDVQNQNPQPVAYVLADHLPNQGHGQPEPIYAMHTSSRTEACPLCGGVGTHTHTEHEAIPQAPPTVVPVYPVSPAPSVRRRPRSKSASRVRHYSPDGRGRTRYIVRQYSDESSEESDDSRYRRRSRSVDRSRRPRRGRRYRKVKTRFHVNGNQGGGDEPVVVSETNNSNSEPPSDEEEGEFEDALNESLGLTEEIDDLTHKMMHTVKGELAKAKKKKGFGSSIW